LLESDVLLTFELCILNFEFSLLPGMKHISIILLSFFLTGLQVNGQNWQWSHQIGSDYMFYGERAKVISDGNDVFLIGSYGGTLYLPNHTLQSNGNNDIFIAKFDAAGNDLWAKSLGGDYNQPDYYENASGVYD